MKSKSGIFYPLYRCLHGLGLMEDLAGPRLYCIIQREIKEYINQCVSEKYDVGHLEALTKVRRYSPISSSSVSRKCKLLFEWN